MICRILTILLIIISTVSGQCTWQSEFYNTVWHDSTRGDITFSTTTMTGWLSNIRSQTFNTWECMDNSSSTYLIMKATTQLTYSSLTFNVYACLQLTQITSVSYSYYQQNLQESNGGYERLRFSQTALSTAAEICDFTASVPTQEFHVLVKSGSESSAAITCPTNFLFSADYVYNDTSTYACADSADVWDVCSSTSEMTFNYSTCSQLIAFTSGGRLWCVASVGQCVSVYNQDSTLTALTRQFSCLCSDGSSVAVAPNNCTATQTPGVIPTGPDGVSAIGHVVTVGNKYVDCAPVTEAASTSGGGGGGGGGSIGLVIGIVIGLLLLVAIIIIICCLVRHKKKKGKNKVTESAKPILMDTEAARVETINETSRASRPKRERTSLSREGSRLDKSLVNGRASVTSIGLESKSDRGLSREKTTASRRSLDREKSTVSVINVKPAIEDKEKTDKESPVKVLLAKLPCWPTGKEPEQTKEPEPETAKIPPPIVAKKGAAGKKGAKKGGAAAAKGGKGKGGKKGGKGDKDKGAKDEKKGKDKKTDKTDVVVTDVEEEVPKPSTPRSGTPTPRDVTAGTPVPGTPTPGIPTPATPKTKKETPTSKKEATKTKKGAQKSKDSGPQFTSTPIPKDSKEKSFVAGGKMPTFVSMPSSLHKPEDRKTGWPFLVCCAGDSQPVQEEPPAPEPEPVVEAKKPAKKGKPAAKGKGKPAKKGGGGEKGKKKGTKPETNGKVHTDATDNEDEPEKLNRANTMPERQREKTALSLTDAEKVKVDVYVPNEETQLQLKDTVTVIKAKNGEVPLEKSKTTLGLTRPASSGSKGSKPGSTKKAEKGDESSKKGKKEKGKAGKEKKGGGGKKKKK